jgi:energy-coupling factor transporter ATP-binding protein EcfA2
MYYRMSGVWLAYPGTKEYALQEVSLTIPKGSLVAIIGPEACGKTTLARVILGIIKPQVRVRFRHRLLLHLHSFNSLGLAQHTCALTHSRLALHNQSRFEVFGTFVQ